MKTPQPSRGKRQEGELQHYVHERPDLLLKMLDIAENCWHENMDAAGKRKANAA